MVSTKAAKRNSAKKAAPVEAKPATTAATNGAVEVPAKVVDAATKTDAKVEVPPIASVQKMKKTIDEKVETEAKLSSKAADAKAAAAKAGDAKSPDAKPAADTEKAATAPAGEASKDTGAGVPTTFEWTATGAKEVILTGSFNDWKQDLVMKNADGKFSIEVPLPAGQHKYKFVADGEWCYDFTMPNEPDESGNVNNVVTIS